MLRSPRARADHVRRSSSSCSGCAGSTASPRAAASTRSTATTLGAVDARRDPAADRGDGLRSRSATSGRSSRRAFTLREPRAGPPVRPARARRRTRRTTSSGWTCRRTAAAHGRAGPGQLPDHLRPPHLVVAHQAGQVHPRVAAVPGGAAAPAQRRHQAAQGRGGRRRAPPARSWRPTARTPAATAATRRWTRWGWPSRASTASGIQRKDEAGLPIDTSGELDGSAFKTPAELGALLAQQRQAGRLRGPLAVPLRPRAPGERGGRAAARGAGPRDCERDGYRFPALVANVIKSEGFRYLSRPADRPRRNRSRRKEHHHAASPRSSPAARCCAGRLGGAAVSVALPTLEAMLNGNGTALAGGQTAAPPAGRVLLGQRHPPQASGCPAQRGRALEPERRAGAAGPGEDATSTWSPAWR